MKHITIALSIAATCLSSATFAQPHPDGGKPPRPPKPAEVAEFIAVDFDDNQSGGLDAVEFASALAFLHDNRPRPPRTDMEDRPEPPAPDHEATAAGLVEAFDLNGDAQLDEAELAAALKELRKHHPRPPHPGQGNRPPREEKD